MTPNFISVPFKVIWESIVSKNGLDPDQPIPHNMAQAIPRNANKRLRTAWTYWEWPYFDVCDERAFQRTWLPDHQFKWEDKVIFVGDLHYYQAKSEAEAPVLDPMPVGPPLGNPPTDTQYWKPLEQYGSVIDFNQICRRPIGMVSGVYPGDPRNNGCGTRGLCFRPQENGIHVCSSGPTVFVKYQIPVPRFSLAPYAPGKQYKTGNLVYSGEAGECYIAIDWSIDIPPPNPLYWLRQQFPAIFEDYVVLGTYADGLKEIDQKDGSRDAAQQQMRMMWAREAGEEAEEKLAQEVVKLQAMGQRFAYRSWRETAHTMRRGYCQSVCFDPTAGAIPAPPVTTLKEICETDPTAYPPPPPPPAPVVIEGPPGAEGPSGPAGAAGERWFSGDGPPPDPYPGANPGDWYLDELTGEVYELNS
jgi:hypothetical protein